MGANCHRRVREVYGTCRRHHAFASDGRMNFLDHVTVLILTYNEEDNIGRTLQALARFPRIIVVDSQSTDRTACIVAGFTNAALHTRAFDQHAAQWNYGLSKCNIDSRWVFALDADYVVTSELVDEIAELDPDNQISGYRVAFNYCVYGRKLTSSLYPAHVALFRRERARYEQHGHTQRLVLEGKVGNLRNTIEHDDRKPLARWMSSQQRYAALEADYLLSKPEGSLRCIDKIRRSGTLAPLFVFFYTLFWKGCIVDGWPGWFYVLQRTLAEMMIALEVVERRVRKMTLSK